MESISGNRLGKKRSVLATKPTAHSAVKTDTCGTLRRPAGKCRPAVRGFVASMRRSARRLNAIAKLRAVTMQSSMPTISCQRIAKPCHLPIRGESRKSPRSLYHPADEFR